jgi:crotonobetainyl-CoA:carnitine CoA-transferase CaiB-like acyl-CoA transferase
MFEEIEVGGSTLKIPAILPKLSDTPGATEWGGPEVGSHNTEILGGLLGLSEEEMEELRNQGVV